MFLLYVVAAFLVPMLLGAALWVLFGGRPGAMQGRLALRLALLKVLDSYRSVISIWSVYISRSPHGESGRLISPELAGRGVRILLLLLRARQDTPPAATGCS